jgi:starvation-inducible DNA-binding protein
MLCPIPQYKDSRISEEIRKKNAEALAVLLASDFLLFTKMLQFHWNVKGKFFGSLHELFEEGYSLLYEIIDNIAERITQLGYLAPGTTREFQAISLIKEENKTRLMTETEMLEKLREDLITIIIEKRNIINATSETDPATNNKITDILENIEKYLWKVQSHLL